MAARARARTTFNPDGLRSLIEPGGQLYRHAVLVGEAVAGVAKLKVGVDTGRLRQSINSRVIVQRTQVTARISARPRYAKVHHEGRGPVVARNARALRFRAGGSNGPVIYRKRVGPAAGNPFLTDAVREVTGKTPRRRDAAPDGV